MFQPKAYMKYPLEGITYTLDFLHSCNTFIRALTKKLIVTLNIVLSKQFQVPCNTLIFFLSSLISIVVRLVRKTTKEVGATKQMGFSKYLLH